MPRSGAPTSASAFAAASAASALALPAAGGLGHGRIVRRQVEHLLLRQRRDEHAHDHGIALVALEVLELLVDRRDAVAGQVRDRGIGADPVGAVAVVAGRGERGAARRIALRSAARVWRASRRPSSSAGRRAARTTRALLPPGKPTARQIASHKPAVPGCAEGSQTKPTATAATNSTTVAPIHTAKRESGEACRAPSLIAPAPGTRERRCPAGTGTAPAGSRSWPRSAPAPAAPRPESR